MKCQVLFSGENKKNIINLSSAELDKRVVKVKILIKKKTDTFQLTKRRLSVICHIDQTNMSTVQDKQIKWLIVNIC